MAIRRMARVRDKGRVSRTRVRDNEDKGLEAPHMQVTCQGHVTANPSGPIPKAPGSGFRAGREIGCSPRVSNIRSPPAALLQRQFLRRRKAKPLVASPTKGPTNPANPRDPRPVPAGTRTPEKGYGFSRVRMRVALGNPRVTRANHYVQPGGDPGRRAGHPNEYEDLRGFAQSPHERNTNER
ncbi:hypothetical protein EDB86DRAFT_2831600 [Lactarius hatsudake]|nr:hypothetical protein EDB86DRAFT_2831600 [Lactarius hatsudake]